MTTIDLGALHSAHAERYFTRADRRVMIGLRATLELLGLPVPDYARRKFPQASPATQVMRAYRADYPEPRRMELAPRKPNAAAPN